jgi:dTDP-4-dehydrorhamnose 3,5-epimerase
VSGAVYDVVVDLRRSSSTFGQWAATELSAENHHQLWIPPGFAHGFMAISDSAECVYKTTDYWSPPDERTLLWNDPALAIPWPLSAEAVLSEKDKLGVPLAQAEVFS